jgi:hypothetical protein
MKPQAGTRGFVRRVPGTALGCDAKVQTRGRRKTFQEILGPAKLSAARYAGQQADSAQ